MEIFGLFTTFYEKIISLYRDVNEEQTAVRRLRTLKQIGLVIVYTTSFMQESSKLDQEDGPLIKMYYTRLKDRVKDEIT